MSDVLYVYGFIPSEDPATPDELTGLEDRPVEEIPLDGFRAVVSRLPAEEYGEKALEARMDDLRWLGERGLLHERVVTWYVDHGVILPARFLTLHSSRPVLEQEAGRNAARIRTLLDRFRGRREWDLKVSYDPEVLQGKLGDDAPDVRDLDRKIEEASPGRRYLLERRRDELARDRVREVADHLASTLMDGLADRVEALELLPVTRGEEGERLVRHAALLVVRDAEADLETHLEERIAGLAERGVRVDFTGPWAPYRFIDDAAQGEDANGVG